MTLPIPVPLSVPLHVPVRVPVHVQMHSPHLNGAGVGSKFETGLTGVRASTGMSTTNGHTTAAEKTAPTSASDALEAESKDTPQP